MDISILLSTLEDFSTEKLRVSVVKSGMRYDKFPKVPYQTDIFLIKDKINDIQYEVYAVKICDTYEIVEIMKISKEEVFSSIGKDDSYNQISEEVVKLLTNSKR